MRTYLLDANVLIALTVADHEHHEVVSVWASRGQRFALCPIVEGSLVRFLVRLGETARAATELLRLVHAHLDARSGPTRCPTVMPTSTM